jgi:hypothetical protein
MPWHIHYNPALRCIETVYTGGITALDMQESTSKGISLGRENDTNRFLLDATEAELSASFMDVYARPAIQYDAEGVDRVSRLAVVAPRSPRAREAIQFFETVCVNRGWGVKVFPSRQEALDWLIGPNPSVDVGGAG